MTDSVLTRNPLQIDPNESEKEETPESNTKCTERLGLDGVLIILLLFSIGGGFVYYAHLSTANFRVFSRRPVYVFFILAAMYFGLGVNFALTWRTLASRYDSEFSGAQTPNSNGARRNVRRSTKLGTIRRCLRIRRLVQINSPYFLWKLYSFETIGYIVQLFNFTTIYLCTLPPWFNVCLAALFVVEAVFSAITIRSELTTRLRDSVVKVDIVLDAIDAAAPLIVIDLLRIRIPMSEMLQIILWPAISLLSKLRSIFMQVIRKRTADTTIRVSRALRSFEDMAATQQRAVPLPVRHGIFVATVVYAIFMAGLGVWVGIASSVSAEECRAQGAEYIWSNCFAKVPICNDFFAPDCNCAVVDIENHNMTRLPDVVNSMTALRRVKITNGPLKVLDDGFGGRAEKLSFIDMDFNRLTSLPESFGSMESLHTVYMAFNEIDTVPEGFWKLPEMYDLDLSTNKLGHTFTRAKLDLPNLHFANLQNNSIGSFPAAWNSPYLLTLALSGKKVIDSSPLKGKFPHLKYLSAARNRINSTAFLDESEELWNDIVSIDIRNNSLRSIPSWLYDIPYLYASGNPACESTSVPSKYCKRQCSDYCTGFLFNDIKCEFECNSESCDYDNGQCKT